MEGAKWKEKNWAICIQWKSIILKATTKTARFSRSCVISIEVSLNFDDRFRTSMKCSHKLLRRKIEKFKINYVVVGRRFSERRFRKGGKQIPRSFKLRLNMKPFQSNLKNLSLNFSHPRYEILIYQNLSGTIFGWGSLCCFCR